MLFFYRACHQLNVLWAANGGFLRFRFSRTFKYAAMRFSKTSVFASKSIQLMTRPSQNAIKLNFFSHALRLFALLAVGLTLVGSLDAGYAQLMESKGHNYQEHIPAGWKLIKSIQGNLTRVNLTKEKLTKERLPKDGIEDVVLVLEQNDPQKFIKNEFVGMPELNINPRRLIILTPQNGKLKPIMTNDTFIPSSSDQDIPALLDPFQDIKIKDRVLVIVFEEMLSAGSSSCSRDEFKFRYNPKSKRFHLIGQEHSEYNRNSGDKTTISKNYLTKKKKEITGLNEFQKPTARPKTTWAKITKNNERYLDEIKDRYEFYSE